MQRASPLNSSRDRATLSRPCCPLLHPVSARVLLLAVPSLIFFLPSLVRLFTPVSFVVFAYSGRVIMVLYALLDPPSSFLSAKTNLHLHYPDCRFLVLYSSPFSSFFFRAFRSCQTQPSSGWDPPLFRLRNDKIVHFCQPPFTITGFLKTAAKSTRRFLFPLFCIPYIYIIFYAVCYL